MRTLFTRLRIICVPAILSLLPACRNPRVSGNLQISSVCTKDYIEAIRICEPERAMAPIDFAELRNALTHFDAINLKSIICRNGLHRNNLALYHCKELYGYSRLEEKEPEEYVSLLERMATLSVRNGYHAGELSVAYQAAEKENELFRQAAMLRRRNMMLLVMGATLILGILLLVVLIRKNTLIRQKNKAAKALVDELLKYREEVFRIKGQPVEENPLL